MQRRGVAALKRPQHGARPHWSAAVRDPADLAMRDRTPDPTTPSNRHKPPRRISQPRRQRSAPPHNNHYLQPSLIINAHAEGSIGTR